MPTINISDIERQHELLKYQQAYEKIRYNNISKYQDINISNLDIINGFDFEKWKNDKIFYNLTYLYIRFIISNKSLNFYIKKSLKPYKKIELINNCNKWLTYYKNDLLKLQYLINHFND